MFYNAAGTQITGGNVTDAPIAAYVEGTSTVRSGDTVATLYGYLPISGEPTSEWSGLQLGGSTSFPNAGAPAPLNTATLPVETGASGDDTILDLETVYPNLGTGSYADTYQLRLYTNAAGKSQTTTYDSADISISGTGDTATWSVVYPTTPTFSSLGVLPASPEQFGTSETLTATVSPSAAAGTVQFEVGTTDIGTPVTVTSGSAQTTTSALPVGADTLDAVFTPTTSSGYSVSNALAPFTVSTASEGTTTSLNAVTTPITYGSETAETFTGTVTGQSGDGYPKGSVTVYYGASPTVLCNEALPAGSGDSANFSCALDGEPADTEQLRQRRCRLHPGGHLVVEPGLHLHDVDLDPDAEHHGGSPVRGHHHIAQRGDHAHHLRRRDLRDLHRHGDGSDRRRLPRGDGDRLLRVDTGLAVQRDPARGLR